MAIKKPFRAWIKSNSDERDRKVEIVKNLDIAVTEAAYKAFMGSTHTSSKFNSFFTSQLNLVLDSLSS